MNVKIIDGEAYQYYDSGFTKEQYKRVKKNNPDKRFRKIRDDVYINVETEFMKWKRKQIRDNKMKKHKIRKGSRVKI